MRKSVWSSLLLSALLLHAAVATIGAQNAPDQSGRAVVIGCLQRAGGRYTLKDARAGTYVILGDQKELDNHVGHTVELVGRFQGSGDSAPFRADSVIYVSPTCQ